MMDTLRPWIKSFGFHRINYDNINKIVYVEDTYNEYEIDLETLVDHFSQDSDFTGDLYRIEH